MGPAAAVGGAADGLVPLGHEVGIAGELPVPLWMVAYGAVALLVAVVAALDRAWRRPRLAATGPGVALPRPLSDGVQRLEWPLRAVGLLLFAATLGAALSGPRIGPANFAPFAVYVGLWAGGLMVSGLLGDLWRVLNPFETIAKLLDEVRCAPAWLGRAGLWPAAGMLLAFTWVALVHPDPSSPRMLATVIAGYFAVLVAGGLRWGPRWVRAADAFGALFSVLAAMAPLHRDEGGRLRLRPPGRGLARLKARPGLPALLLVALGSTGFDGLTRTGLWASITGEETGWGVVPLATVGLLATIGIAAGIYLWAVRDAARRTATGHGTAALARSFAHSLVPIVLAYAVAHYFSLLVFSGQRMLALASDPFGLGWDLLGTAGWGVDLTAVSPTTIAVVQVVAIVAGHVAAVVLAHDRAAELFEPDAASQGRYGLLVAMVAYTIGALLVLLGA